ncbi:uncharacterized protein LOC142003718 [Carettochelys insculpta]|uniref:uncharacterized protein LOC142003718 n=1 Tax=Carettochelys insculpta TaxID=44489 RepID=UPI003EBECE89
MHSEVEISLLSTPGPYPGQQLCYSLRTYTHTSSPPATLDTSAEELQKAPEPESAPEASPASRGPPLEPTPGAPEQEEEEEGDSSSTDTGLQILLPSRSSSRVSPDRGSGPTAAPSEGPESAGEASVVPESPPGPLLQASPSAEDRPAPQWARRRSHQQQPLPAMAPQLLALHHRQVEVAEQRLRVEQGRLHLQERALAWHQEAWGAYMETFNRIADYLAPHAAPAASAPALPAPPAAPPAAPVAAPSAVDPPPATEGHSAEGDLGPADTRWPYLPVRPAPSQPRPGLQPRKGSRPPTPSAGL